MREYGIYEVSTAAPNRCFLAFWKRYEDFG